MKTKTIPSRAVRKVAKDGRFGPKNRRPKGTKTEPLYVCVEKSLAAYAKKQAYGCGSISLYIERLILKHKTSTPAHSVAR